ncbi:MAG: hypothetical protein IPI61_12130 [Syntrophaceae bacterium]|nr:hypothetical protein [Syntrophaceae bacterium]
MTAEKMRTIRSTPYRISVVVMSRSSQCPPGCSRPCRMRESPAGLPAAWRRRSRPFSIPRVPLRLGAGGSRRGPDLHGFALRKPQALEVLAAHHDPEPAAQFLQVGALPRQDPVTEQRRHRFESEGHRRLVGRRRGGRPGSRRLRHRRGRGHARPGSQGRGQAREDLPVRPGLPEGRQHGAQASALPQERQDRAPLFMEEGGGKDRVREVRDRRPGGSGRRCSRAAPGARRTRCGSGRPSRGVLAQEVQGPDPAGLDRLGERNPVSGPAVGDEAGTENGAGAVDLPAQGHDGPDPILQIRRQAGLLPVVPPGLGRDEHHDPAAFHEKTDEAGQGTGVDAVPRQVGRSTGPLRPERGQELAAEILHQAGGDGQGQCCPPRQGVRPGRDNGEFPSPFSTSR